MTTFIQQFGRTFGTKTVRITPGPEHPGRGIVEVEGVVQTKTVGFNVDTPVYEGDQLTWTDPRGGETTVWAEKVDVADAGGMMSSFMAHINVTFRSKPPTSTRSPRGGNGHTIVVRGNNVNVALDGSRISQQVSVTQGYESLSDAVGRALALIDADEDVDPDEAEAARDAAGAVLEQTAKPAPDERVIRRGLPTLRGVLNSIAQGSSGAAAATLVEQLFL